ncbi:hypothetical protein C5167_025878 [Papaver somniferum]|uniref:PGG domain-containing protein n=1 Tax=Papaver somniferum TaxID=3469 RepID=A0A4Y7JW01_PAPSO|nr:hypothetical protein C5167_025878 [Papaver somniferum]
MQQNMNGDTPLHVAARSKSTLIVSLFIDHACRYSQAIGNQRNDEDHDINVEEGISKDLQLVRIANKKKNTALHEALRHQPNSGIPQLSRSADRGFEYFSNDSGESPLYLAVETGTPDLVEHMLKICPSQSYGAPGGRTALHALALQDGSNFQGAHLKLVNLLRHIVKEVDKNGRTALHYAVHCRNSEFVDAVMEVDPSVCYMSDKDGMTALHHAAAKEVFGSWSSKEVIKIMKLMLGHCTDCWEVLDNQGRNFLHLAAQNNNSHVLKYVLNEISSDLILETIIGMKDQNGKTPCLTGEEFYPIIVSNPRLEARDWFGVSFNLWEIDLNKQFLALVLLPGGYNSDGPHKGMAVLANKPPFIVFLVSNTSAMVLSAVAIIIQFVGKIVSIALEDPEERKEILLQMAIFCNLLAILAMMVAFVTGIYTVLSHLPELAISVCTLGSIFFVLAFFLIFKIMNLAGKGITWDD